MEERREPPAEAGSHPPIASAGARLSPVQEAWSDYVTHARTKACCTDIDRGPCEEAERLHRAWSKLSNAAMNKVARKSS